MYVRNDPRLVPPVLGLLFAALCVALAWKTDWPAWLRFVLVMAAIVCGTASVMALVDWAVHETSTRIKEMRWAQVADAVQLSNAVKGLSTAQVEFVRSQTVAEVFGIPGDDGMLWRIRFPGGDVELEFIEEFLRASMEVPGDYLWPVRDHTSAHWVAWKDFMDVELKLRILTDGLVHFGKADPATGRYSAKLKPGVTIGDLAEWFRVDL